MPIIVPGTGTREQSITDIIESVALEQTALSHILNAEGEKIQKIVLIATTADEMLSVNKSVERMVKSITKLEMILQGKLQIFEDCLCPPFIPCTPITQVGITQDIADPQIQIIKVSNTSFFISNTQPGQGQDTQLFRISSILPNQPIVFKSLPVGVVAFESGFEIDFQITTTGLVEFDIGTGDCLISVSVQYDKEF